MPASIGVTVTSSLSSSDRLMVADEWAKILKCFTNPKRVLLRIRKNPASSRASARKPLPSITRRSDSWYTPEGGRHRWRPNHFLFFFFFTPPLPPPSLPLPPRLLLLLPIELLVITQVSAGSNHSLSVNLLPKFGVWAPLSMISCSRLWLEFKLTWSNPPPNLH